MKQLRVAFLAILFGTMVFGAIYGAYPKVLTVAIIATAALGCIILVNRFIEPRWGLTDIQRATENRLRFPAIVSMFVVIGLVSIGENGFENLSGSFMMWLAAIILIAVISSMFMNWAKPGK